MNAGAYAGTELEVFARAENWKAYFAERISPFLHGCVLEVGAGIGGTTKVLCKGNLDSWLCLEPDEHLLDQLQEAITSGVLPSICTTMKGTLATLPADLRFDTILYIDVIEHIEDDREELGRAAAHLKPGGHLVVVAPAHPFLYTPFDKAIGHFRRYTRRMLLDIAPNGMRLVEASYLDSVGLLASTGNKLILRSASPTHAQVALWDRWMVPLSRRLDRVLGYGVGKSLAVIWQRDR